MSQHQSVLTAIRHQLFLNEHQINPGLLLLQKCASVQGAGAARTRDTRQKERCNPKDTLTLGRLVSEEEAIFNKRKLNWLEIVAKEISPVCTRCDFCVTDSLSITLRRGGRNTVFLSPLLSVPTSYVMSCTKTC